MLNLSEKVKQLKKTRKRLDLTQKQLAKLVGVSQSFIAKLESGIIDPSYSRLKKVEDALKLKEKGEVKCARDLMNKPVESVQIHENTGKAINLMAKNNYSQLPVFNGKMLVGSITERDIMFATEKYEPEKLKELKVEELMSEAFPTVSPETSSGAIKKLLEENKAVLVKEKGEIIGIIDQADFLKL